MKGWFVAMVGSMVLLAACAPRGQQVTREQFGERWPFTVDAGWVDCIDGYSVAFHSHGTTYALNGDARAVPPPAAGNRSSRSGARTPSL